MPVGRRFDFQLGGQGYLLARLQQGRAWNRSGTPDTPSRRSSTDTQYGQVADVLDHPEVWDDWSGGYGHAYRRNGENTYNWAENFDARNPRQLIHCQQLQSLTKSDHPLEYRKVERFMDVPMPYNLATPGGAGGVMLLCIPADGTWASAMVVLTPTGSTGANSFDRPWVNAQSIQDMVGRPAIYGSFIYLGSRNFSEGFMQIKLSDGSTATVTTIQGTHFTTVGDKMWRAFGPGFDRARCLRSVTNYEGSSVTTEANWSATLNVGDGYLPIKDIETLDEQLFIGKPDGVYAGASSGSFANVLTQLKNQVHEDNCRDLTIHNNAVIVPHISGVYEYRPDSLEARVRSVGPRGNLRGPIQGRFRAVRSFGRWLYGGLYTGSISYLLAGDISGENPVWHTLNRLPAVTSIHRIHFDGISTASSGVKIPNRMWIATDASVPNTTASAPVYFAPIPTNNDNPLNASLPFKSNYVATARIDLGSVDWGAPSTPKVFRSVEVWADNLLDLGVGSGTQRYFELYYDVDQSGSFTLLGTGNVSPKSIVYFPSTSGSFITGQSIELSLRSYNLDLVVGYRSTSPVYRAIILRGSLRPNSIDEITAQVRIADNLRDRQGGVMRSAATMISELRALAVQSNPTTLIDLAGAVNYVNVIAPIQEQEVWQQGDDNPEIVATIKMAVTTFS